MCAPPTSCAMDPTKRREKKRREALRLRSLSPAQTMEMGFSLCDFARELSEAARHARR